MYTRFNFARCLPAFTFGLFSLLGCGQPGFEAYEATSAEEVILTSEFPMVVFVALPEGQGLCTGAFISKRAILTAAHCTQRTGTYKIFTSFGVFSSAQVINLSQGLLEDPHDVSVILVDEDAASWDEGQIAYIGEPAVAREKVTLVGFGCDSLKTRLGSGKKRMGTNYVDSVGDYLELITPDTGSNSRGILGPLNRAGSCFGDSGGPLLRMRGNVPEVIGIAHSGGYRGTNIVSRYVDVHNHPNLKFLEDLATQHNLDITPACSQGSCNQPAMGGIGDFLAWVWRKIQILVAIRWF